MTPSTSVRIWAPGRVNLIGEHTDYNDGWVLPMAIERGTSIDATQRDDGLLVSHAERMGESDSIALSALDDADAEGWRAYVRGSVRALREAGQPLGGAELRIGSDLPLGGGLSSSASLEVGIIVAFQALYGGVLSPSEIALLAQRAEREYVGVNCGIMDQLAVAAGQAGHALLIDCRSLAIKPVAMPNEAVVVIVDSGVSRSLAGSVYNQRRAECEAAVAALGTVKPGIQALRDATSADLATLAGLVDATVYKRARHVISENERTLAAAAALEAGDLVTVGQLMNASHQSLAEDYEVSSAALDTLAGLLRAKPGVYGARLTGAGFGGCCIALVAREAAASVAATIGAEYAHETRNHATVIPTEAAAGAGAVGHGGRQ